MGGNIATPPMEIPGLELKVNGVEQARRIVASLVPKFAELVGVPAENVRIVEHPQMDFTTKFQLVALVKPLGDIEALQQWRAARHKPMPEFIDI